MFFFFFDLKFLSPTIDWGNCLCEQQFLMKLLEWLNLIITCPTLLYPKRIQFTLKKGWKESIWCELFGNKFHAAKTIFWIPSNGVRFWYIGDWKTASLALGLPNSDFFKLSLKVKLFERAESCTVLIELQKIWVELKYSLFPQDAEILVLHSKF